MEKVLEFEINGLPKMSNDGLRGTHWSVKKKEADNWKRAVNNEVVHYFSFPETRDKFPGSMEKAKLILTRFSSTSPDPDGLVSGFKHVVDGLVEAGVLKNDKISNIGMPEYRWEKCAPKKGKIRVEVYSE